MKVKQLISMLEKFSENDDVYIAGANIIGVVRDHNAQAVTIQPQKTSVGLLLWPAEVVELYHTVRESHRFTFDTDGTTQLFRDVTAPFGHWWRITLTGTIIKPDGKKTSIKTAKKLLFS